MRRFIFAISVLILSFCLIPAIMLLFGVCGADHFFRKPPKAVLKTLHCDHNVRDAELNNTMRLTSTIKTHNMEDSIVEFRMGVYYYWDGSPVLSKYDTKPIEIQRRLIVPVGRDTTFLEISSLNYDMFPPECSGKQLKCRVYLTYKDAKGEFKEHKQGENTTFKVNQ